MAVVGLPNQKERNMRKLVSGMKISVDGNELRLIVHPLIAGEGKALFAEGRATSRRAGEPDLRIR
jgi:hypothetical protein